MENKQVIISIGREFGSGGHEIAEKLSKIFNLPLYDYNLLREVASEKNVNAATLEPYDEVPPKGFTSRTVRGYTNSIQGNIAYLQFDFLKDKANKGQSFIVVGRCAEEVLKEYKSLISFFVLGDMESKIERICRLHNINKEDAKRMIIGQDKKRKNYHNHFCERKWGDSRNYELSINSSKIGIDATTEFMVRYINERMQKM